MSLCDRCMNPGSCCTNFNLSGEKGSLSIWDGDDVKEQLELIAGGTTSIGDGNEVTPFRPLYIAETWSTPDTLRVYHVYRYFCTWLMPDGRCGNYDHRPALCRSFEPASGPLCIHYWWN